MAKPSNLRTMRQLGFKAQLILLLTSLLVLLTLRTALAEGSHSVTTTTTTVTTVTDAGQEAVAQPSPTTPSVAPQDFTVTARFGLTAATQGLNGCKTESLAKDLVRDLKSDCSAWLKDRKSELNGGSSRGGQNKDKYLTGTCQEECSDCGMGLQRCSVVGTVHYRP